jgi:hypothetical protein
MINFKDSEFFYDPYPYAIIKNIFEKEIYDELKKEFPDSNDEKFDTSGNSKKKDMGKFNKFQIDNFKSKNFNNVIKNRKTSKLIYNFFKSEKFINIIDEFLISNHVNIKLIKKQNYWQSFFKKNFNIYFELSSIPCDGGFIAPHTDAPRKIITCVMPIVDKEEISNLKGVGTSMLEATNIKYKYNFLNQTVPLSDTKEIKYIDFLPNQMLMFIKTYNSLHSVGPIKSTNLTKSLKRKSINVSIVEA